MNINTLLYRVFIFLFFMLAGSLAGARFFSISQSNGIGALLGAFAGILVFLVERAISRTQPHVIFGGGVGALAGAMVALGVGRVLGFSEMPPLFILSILILAGHMGFVAGARGIRAFSVAKSSQGLSGASVPKLLDTSSIIDGRIVEMVRAPYRPPICAEGATGDCRFHRPS
ncbi:MAG: hypothetical protein C0609_11075 [Deltaproteobacteria bacterium]|nr:MAG: hypothetical protein C0609_11075 [Deltaproteobacteria bacterium]